MKTFNTSYSKNLILMSLIFPSFIFAKTNIPDFQTTRMKSIAGAGVGSILMDEATILNPAPLSFFNNGAFFIQKSGADTTSTVGNQTTTIDDIDDYAIVASDGKGALNGSLSYVKQSYQFSDRVTMAASVASRVGKKSSFGGTIKFIKDNISENGIDYQENKIRQSTFGVTHFLAPEISVGLVFVDPLKARPEDTRAILGFQYLVKNLVTLLLDVGSDYNESLSEKFLWRSGIQVKFLDDFFVRAGVYSDEGKKEKGSGVGAGWVGPKLSLDVALKNSEFKKDILLEQENETVKETSISLSYKF